MRDFFGAVLPDEGHYRLVDLSGKGGKTTWAGSLEDFCDIAEQRAGHQRIYFGTASYREPTKGEAANVLFNKALRLDIDAGEAKFTKHKGVGVYKTQQDALRAVVEFSKATKLEPSYIVSSGAGLHVYYALERALAPAEWSGYADRLYSLCQLHDLLVDHTTTTDVTRLLRVPGGIHENGTEVRVLYGKGLPLPFDALDSFLPKRPRFDADDMALTDEFVGDMRAERRYPPASAFKIANRCGALRAIAEVAGDVPEPQWRAMVGLVKHTVEGDDQVHAWSEGYEGYDYQETQKKIDLWKLGPATCDEFAKHCDECVSCPHRGKIKSPIQLGQMNDAEQSELPPEQQTTLEASPAPAFCGDPWDGMLPPGSRVVRDDAGSPQLQFMVRVQRKDEDGESISVQTWVPVSNTVFWFTQWGAASSESAVAATARASICIWRGSHVEYFGIDTQALSSQADMLKALASQAVLTSMHPQAPRALYDYSRAQFMHIQSNHRTLRVTDRLGLRILPTGEMVAVHGRYTIHGDGVISHTFLDESLRSVCDHYPIPLPPSAPGHQRWGPGVWDSHIIPAARQHVAFLNKHYGSAEMARYQLAIMLAVASPLMAFVTQDYRSGAALPTQSSLTVSLYSKDGGYGKTTAGQAGVLAYGDPNRLVEGMNDQGATPLYRLARLSYGGTMPLVMDEMGTLAPKSAMELLSSVANGNARGRLGQDGTLRVGPPWALINVITTNRSMQELLQSGDTGDGDAVKRRLLEIDVGDMKRADINERSEFNSDWAAVKHSSQGALGAVLQREMCRMGVEGLHRLMESTWDRANSMVKGSMSDRFYVRALSAMLVAYMLLSKLDLAPFNAKHLLSEFLRAHKNTSDLLADATVKSGPLDHINRALNDLLPWTVITKSEVHRAGQGADLVLNERMPDTIKARHIKDQGKTYVVADQFRIWCEDRKLSEWELIGAAQRADVLISPKKGNQKGRVGRHNITRGLRTEVSQSVYVYTFDTRRLQHLLDERAGIPLELRDDPPAGVVDLQAERAARKEAKEKAAQPAPEQKAGTDDA